uniref:Putative CFS1-like protein n=1 Tax=Moniliophthora roreri TaxID=221103 RepID=A0A0W0G7Q8_MONRR
MSKPTSSTSPVGTLISSTYTNITYLAQLAVTRVMSNIRSGSLRILDYPSSRVYSFGSSSSSPVELRVISPTFWLRLFFMGDLGFSESYMYGEVSTDDLIQVFKLFLANRAHLATLDGTSSWVLGGMQRILNWRFVNNLSNSRSNISAHYDISNDMFKGFLSRDMTYSCAIWNEVDGDLMDGERRDTRYTGGQGILRIGQKSTPTYTTQVAADAEDPLYTAQMNKLKYIISLLRIPPFSDTPFRVLEIGSGWGSLSILLAQTYPHVHINTLTLSTQQKSLAEELILAQGLQDRITVHLMDYRSMPKEWQGVFDRVVSVEMVEAVGREYLQTYWEKINTCLHPTRGIGVVQSITIPEARFERYIREVDFIQKWIFPGGFLPTLTLLLTTLQAGSNGTLTIDSVENIGPHYARTLREWRRRFLETFEEVIRPALVKELGKGAIGKEGEEVEVFKRKWLCELLLLL